MKQLQSINNVNQSRRNFLVKTTLFGGVSFIGSLAGVPLNAISAMMQPSKLLGFKAIPISTEDQVIVPEGYKAEVLISWGDKVFPHSPAFDPNGKNTSNEQALQFGENNDGMSLFSVDENNAVLAINHEYIDAKKLFAHGSELPLSVEDVNKAKAALGLTIIAISRTDQQSSWKINLNSKYNRRVTLETPMHISGPAKGHHLMKTIDDPKGDTVLGTIGNCANGKTLWGTYLTCEENFNAYFAYTDEKDPALFSELEKRYGTAKNNKRGWGKFDPRFDLSKNPNELNRFGWVVEVDPLDPKSTPIKRTALGRFMHENAAVTLAKNGHVVVYMGDDSGGHYIYKFVTKEKFIENNDSHNRQLLDEGTLYVSKFNPSDTPLKGAGEWIALVHGQNGLDQSNGFESQADIVINARKAGDIVLATPMDRPEWVAVHPKNGQVFCTLTNNKSRGDDKTPVNAANPRVGNVYGQIIRWVENNDDHTALTFNWDIYVLAGNPNVYGDGDLRRGTANVTVENTFNSPDGLGFDDDGRLWIQTDGSWSNTGDYLNQGNNSMLVGDPDTGEIRRFLVGPNSCELTGLCFTPDSKTMFVNIQHPGAAGDSTFPNNSIRPRPSVMMITKDDNGVIGS